MTIPCLLKRIVFLPGILCSLFSLHIEAQDTSSGLIRFFKIEKATNKNAVHLNRAITAKNNDSVYVNFFSRPKIEISIMPNPVFNNASIIIQTEETGDISCILYDLSGKNIRTYQFKKTAYYAQHILDMYNVPKGEYILNIRGTVINEAKRILKL